MFNAVVNIKKREKKKIELLKVKKQTVVACFQFSAHVIKRETNIKVRLCTVKNKNMRS